MDRQGFKQALVASLLFAAAAPAHAQVTPYHVAVTPFIGYQLGGSFDDKSTNVQASLNDARAEGVLLDLPANDIGEYEFFYLHQGTDFDLRGAASPQPSRNVDLHFLQLGGTYVFEGEYVYPYIAATLGATFLDPAAPGSGPETDFSFGLGAGARFFPASRISLRLEGRALGTVVSSDSGFFCSFGNSGGGCLINSRAEVLWQFVAFAGAAVRF